jgi:hypothetical protein
MIIDHINFAHVERNLLVALDALLTEHNVPRAATRLGFGQSAMSHNLARLRNVFRDQILVRRSDGMHQPPRALALTGPWRSRNHHSGRTGIHAGATCLSTDDICCAQGSSVQSLPHACRRRLIQTHVPAHH